MAREALAVTGAAIGFVASGGNPQGALVGFNIGYGVGSYVDPVTIKAPGLNDAPIQTSRDGVPITLFWGLQYGHGNIIQKNPEEIVTETERVGKGGGTEVESQRRFRTFAIGIGQGPYGSIHEVTRIWENNKLVYDVRDTPAISAEETAAYAEGITIYTGDESQLPDTELESHWGTDETPAYRGLAYIVFNNKDLTDFGGSIPQFAFEVNGSKDYTITSRPYPVEAVDGITFSVDDLNDREFNVPIEGIDQTVTVTSISIAAPLVEHTVPTEGIEQTVTVPDITLRTLLNEYDITEGIDQTVTVTDITLAIDLVEYTYEPEGIDQTVTVTNITLI
ncbi:hypothetical protein [Elongatibacter sediminis]|uniref:Tip attachment protein J domain-containing protein n=1 Tax=Elongatibacter sediminis TaxID=3119006 RepID=A0AAW9R9M4_9GAMM